MASMLSPQYVEFKEQIRTEMFTIKQKMNELRASHGKATLTSFDDSNSHDVEIEVCPGLGGLALQSGERHTVYTGGGQCVLSKNCMHPEMSKLTWIEFCRQALLPLQHSALDMLLTVSCNALD